MAGSFVAAEIRQAPAGEGLPRTCESFSPGPALVCLAGVLTHNDVPEEPIVTLAHGRTAHRIHEARKQVLLLATNSDY